MASSIIDMTDLMKRAQAGDQASYRQLLKHARAVAVGFLRRRLSDQQAVDDVCQNVLLKLHVARHTYDPTQPFPPWLFAILRNAMFDHLRHHKRHAERVELVETYQEDFGEGAVAEMLLVCREALGELSDDQRSALEMVKVEGLTMEEASERAGVSVGAIKVRAHRAYKTLRAALLKSNDEAS